MKRSTIPVLVTGLLFGACDKAPEAEPQNQALEVVREAPDEADWMKAGVASELMVEPAARHREDSEKVSASVERKLTIKGPKNNQDLDLKRARDTSVVLALGNLQGDAVGSANGSGGLGLRGAGKGGGGVSERGIGLGNVGTVGRGSGSANFGRVAGLGKVDTGGGKGTGYGRGSGSLGERRAVVPRVRMGSATVNGHSATPIAEPQGAESYKDHGTNRFTDPTEDRFSTFSIDVDTGSYTIARRKLNGGTVPPKASVRVEEFVNYFGYNYPKPKSGAFRVSMEAAPSPFATDGKTHLLRVGVQGKTIESSKRKPVHLTFLVDVSGSMQRPDKIGLAKKSLRILTDNLKEGDTVAMATYAGRTEILLQPTRAKGKIIDAIERLSAGGSTAMASGLDLAYSLAAKNLKRSHENRVIVLSDGDANVGRTGWGAMLKQISGQVAKGITMSTIGFGMGNYKDSTMEQLADRGNGNYYYIDSEKEAFKVFGDQIDGTLQVIAKDVKLQVDFNPEAVHRYRLVGYENRDIADKDFRNDKVDAGEIGAGHTVTALYEVELKDELPDRIATVRVRHKEPQGSDKASEQSFGFDRDDIKASIGNSSKDFQFAAAVAAFAEKLRKSPYAKKLTYDWILEIAQGATKGRADRKEFVSLVKKAKRA